METNDLVNLAERAFDAGVAEDQLQSFIKYKYVPLPWALKFHAAARIADKDGGPVDIGCGGARGPGKSTAIFAQLALDDCQRTPGLKGLFLRETGKSADESFQDLIDENLRGKIRFNYTPTRGHLEFSNGSKILLGGFKDEGDIDKYTGIQYDVMAIEERNQLSGEKVLKLKGSLRTTKPNWRARMYSSFNPGNIGHADIKQTFVIPYQQQAETTTRFFPSTYKDNPFLKPEYIDYLLALPGALGQAWRDGNFDVFEGRYFQEWDYHKHTIAPFTIPEYWKRYRAYDHGHNKPACCKWYAKDTEGRIWVYRELYVNKEEDPVKLDVDQIATEIIRLSGNEVYEYSVADPAIFANLGFTDKYGGQTISETFAHYGVIFLPASNRRVDGWNLMHQYLNCDGKVPKIMYFQTCRDSIRTMPNLIHDKHRPEDLDTDGEDHAADVDRYLLMSLHETKTEKPQNEIEKRIKAINMPTRPNFRLVPGLD